MNMQNQMSGFSGDMDRNEVEIDLNKFMALLQEKSDLKDRIRELEDEKNDNPYQKFILLSSINNFILTFFSFFLHIFQVTFPTIPPIFKLSPLCMKIFTLTLMKLI